VARLRRAVRAAALLAVAGLVTPGCRDPGGICENAAVARVASPDGTREAVLFQRSCGATTGYSTQLSLVGRGEEPAGAGTAFVADTDHGKAAAAGWGGPWAEPSWRSPTQLLVRYDRRARLFRSEDNVDGVTIRYEAVDRPAS
jgi:hypothetical protein